MDSFRINKLLDTILVQSRLSKSEAMQLAEDLEKNTNWELEFNYQKIAGAALESLGLLRTQTAKACKIRKGTRIKK